MEIIDAHQHFWNYNPIRDSWITEEMHRIRNNFLPQDLIALLQQNNVSGTVAVQADQSEVETGFLLELAEQVDFIKGVVGWVDLQNDRLEDRLIYYRQFKKLKGFRHVLQGEQQRDLMLTPTFKNGISKLELSGFTYDILIYPDQLRYIPAFAAAFPNQKMIIDHIVDAHEWHILTYNDFHLSIPLPVILLDNGKFVIFSSRHFHHGHEAYNGYRMMTQSKDAGR